MRSLIELMRADFRVRRYRRQYPQCVVHPGVVVTGSSSLGPHCVLFRNVALCDADIGAMTYVQSSSQLTNVDVGPFCSIASEVVIGLVDHPQHFVGTSPVFYDNHQPLPCFLVDEPLESATVRRTTIGADTWIGQRAMIKAGVTVGVGSIIAAGAVVTRDVAPYSIIAGVPARQIRTRFDESICRGLIASKWWLREADELRTLARHFGQPEAFLARLKELPCSS